MTDIADGVKFRANPTDPLLQMSWPSQQYHNAWLVLDRNGNGKIDDFTELFGNMTSQPMTGYPNGYLALAVFDQASNGGNENGAIDPGDSVYNQLRLWIDANHNGISEPGELHGLLDMGIFRIDLNYSLSRYTDSNGNSFRYQSHVWDLAGANSHVCYDVFVSVQPILVPRSNRAILESALALIDKSGVEKLSLREVARALGVTTAAPYHHFKDREALLVQIAIQGYEQLLKHLEEARTARRASQTELEAESRAYLSFAHERAALYSVMFSSEVAGKDEYPELRQIADQCFHLVCTSVAQSAELSKKRVPRAALCAWSMLHGLAMLDKSNFLEENCAEQAAIAVEGVLSLVKCFR